MSAVSQSEPVRIIDITARPAAIRWTDAEGRPWHVASESDFLLTCRLRWYVLQANGSVSLTDGEKEPEYVPVAFSDNEAINRIITAFEVAEDVSPEAVVRLVGKDGTGYAIGTDWSRVSLSVRSELERLLPGFLTNWSLRHGESPSDFLGGQVDGAIVSHLRLLHSHGIQTCSSCQGGYRPLATAAIERWGGWHDSAMEPGGIVIRDKVWKRSQPHLFIIVGEGHHRGGIVQGVNQVARYVPQSVVEASNRTATLFQGSSGIDAEIYADEMTTHVVLNGIYMNDIEAEAWWNDVIRTIVGSGGHVFA